MLRSANGTQIFGTTTEADMDVTEPDTNVDYTGVGMIVGEGYSSTVRWYNQYRIPIKFGTDTALGVFMPMKVESGYSYTLYCNHITTDGESITFSLMKENDTWKQCTHLVFSNLNKYESWVGGALFSGSSVPSLMGSDVRVFVRDSLTNDSLILPILSSGAISNTFLRIDIGNAPDSGIYWASSGTDNPTNKKLALSITSTNGQIVSYFYLQSTTRLDSGKNVSVLNCLTVDLPMFCAVQVDPNVNNQFAAAGDIPGVYFISLYNMQTSGVYERNYPTSGMTNQVFPTRGRRRGTAGFDGIGIAQDL